MGEHYRGPDYLISDLAELISNISYGMWKHGLSEAEDIRDLAPFDDVINQLREIAATDNQET